MTRSRTRAREFAPDHRCDVQHVARSRIEPLEPRQNDVLYRVGNVDRFCRMRQADRVATPLERTAFVERPDHLLHEERIAVGLRIEEALGARATARARRAAHRQMLWSPPATDGTWSAASETRLRRTSARTRCGASRRGASGSMSRSRPSAPGIPPSPRPSSARPRASRRAVGLRLRRGETAGRLRTFPHVAASGPWPRPPRRRDRSRASRAGRRADGRRSPPSRAAACSIFSPITCSVSPSSTPHARLSRSIRG